MSWSENRKTNPDMLANASGVPGLEVMVPLFVKGALERGIPLTRAAELMTRDPYTAPPGARIDAAVSMMLDNQIHCLPIVENGQLRGMLTSADLMIALDCLLQAIRDLSTGGTTRATDTQTIYNQDTKRFPDTSARPNEPPDTITRPLLG